MMMPWEKEKDPTGSMPFVASWEMFEKTVFVENGMHYVP